MSKIRAPRNRTITLNEDEKILFAGDFISIKEPVKLSFIENKVINRDIFTVFDFIPEKFVDLLILDPPYNLTKTFNVSTFRKMSIEQYAGWFENLLIKLLPTLKKTASIYVCSEWYTSTAIHLVLEKFLKVRNRITWEREKGRGAKRNWKNSAEDIWFATVSDDYVFNVDNVKLKRKVMTPYTDESGEPKDWEKTSQGQFRITHPANLWNDITVPFWSMPENTDHPTQKPEKLLAKLILASTNEGDFVFDPFMGVGSSIVTAKKLGRRFLGVEVEKEFCLLAAKRLHLADLDNSIQGYHNGIFWERNTLSLQLKKNNKRDNLRYLTPMRH